jgi:predicted amidophosphoribosyltransferase
MAKKKTAIPTKKCPKCEKAVHVATRVCPGCGEAFPMKRRKKGRVKKVAAPQAAGDSPLVDAANFVRQAGGIEQAQQALKDLAKVAKALG